MNEMILVLEIRGMLFPSNQEEKVQLKRQRYNK